MSQSALLEPQPSYPLAGGESLPGIAVSAPEGRVSHGRTIRRVLGAAALTASLFGAHAATAEASTYTVHSGDTLTQIADHHHITLEQVLAQNPTQRTTPNSIQPGEKLSLGHKVKAPARYTVKSGDSLSVIAAAHNTSLSHVLKLNPKFQHAPSLIHPGQKVVLKKPSSPKLSPAKHSVAPERTAHAVAPPPKAVEKPAEAHDAAKLLPPNWTAFARELGKIASAGSEKSPAKKPQPAAHKPAIHSPAKPSAKERAHKHYTVDQFMGAITVQESAGSHAAVNKDTHARGYTQIIPASWKEWSAQALGRVKKQTAAREVKVSRYKMEQYHHEFGNWSSVAMAWFAGEAAAKKYLAGDKSVLSFTDGHWTVQQYIAHMQANLGKADPYKLIPELKNLKSKQQEKKHRKQDSKDRAKKAANKSLLISVQKSQESIVALLSSPAAAAASKNTRPAIKIADHKPAEAPVEAIATVSNKLVSGLEKIQSHLPVLDKLAKAAEKLKEQRHLRWVQQARKAIERKIVLAAKHEFKKNGNKMLETKGPNTGPEVQKYTGGAKGVNAPWCSWFVSYVMKRAGYELKGGPAGKGGRIPSVANLSKWFKERGIEFTSRSKVLKPRPGDVIMYSKEHSGVVEKVHGHEIDTIEGNASRKGYSTNGDTVAHRRFDYTKRTDVKIAFGRPKDPNL